MIWNNASRQWESTTIKYRKLIILYIWAMECSQCVEELPDLREIIDTIHQVDVGGSVMFMYVSETLESNANLASFISDKARHLSRISIYKDAKERIRDCLDINGIADAKRYLQPITLLIDNDMIIRHAFVGSIKERRGEVIAAAQRLLPTLPVLGYGDNCRKPR